MAAPGRTQDARPRQTPAATIDASVQRDITDETRVVVQTTRVGRFTLLREIGSGGMGSVFVAYDERLDRKVALKILNHAPAGIHKKRARTLREARAAARVSHPNIIAVYEVGEVEGNIYIAMEYVEGSTLLQWQTQHSRAWSDIVAMYMQAGEALLAAHQAGVVHRDFKPDNVLVGPDERPRVVDFGLARVDWSEDSAESEPSREPPEHDLPASPRLTLPGIIAGTPGYMSPEQYQGGDIGGSSDQWSFCAALFEALYGYLPFSGKTLHSQAEHVVGTPRPRPADTKVPDEIHRALLRGLAPRPEERFPSMAELLAILAQEQRGDLAAGGLLRQRFTRALLVMAGFVLMFILIRQGPRGVKPTDTVAASAFMLGVILLGGLWQRRTLRANPFHRNLWLITLVTVLQNLAQRLLGLALDIPSLRLFPFEMVVFAGSGAIMALTVNRWLLLVSVLPIGAILLSAAGVVSHRVLSLVYPAVLLVLVIGWRRAAVTLQSRHADKNSGSFVVIRGTRTPSRPPDRSSSRRGKPVAPQPSPHAISR